MARGPICRVDMKPRHSESHILVRYLQLCVDFYIQSSRPKSEIPPSQMGRKIRAQSRIAKYAK